MCAAQPIYEMVGDRDLVTGTRYWDTLKLGRLFAVRCRGGVHRYGPVPGDRIPSNRVRSPDDGSMVVLSNPRSAWGVAGLVPPVAKPFVVTVDL